MTTQKNIHDNEPKGDHDLVKHGSNDPRGKAAAAPPVPGPQQGQQGQQQGQTGVMPRQQSPEDRELEQKRQQEAWDAAAEREKSNNPATKKMRDYSRVNQPGLDPGNMPTENTRINKGTRLDLEDLTGNPGHRGVNPDAPANSINGPPSDRTGKVESINEPPGIPNNERPAGLVAGQGVQGSINEPEGSQVIPPGAGQGAGGAAGGIGAEYETPDIEALEPDEIALGAAATTLSVSGTGFTDKSVISMDGEDVPTTFVSAEELTTPLDPAQWSAAGVVQVVVKNGGYKSEEVEFEILEANPVGTRQSKRTKAKPPGKGKGKGRGKR
jgi:hypothetical protein